MPKIPTTWSFVRQGVLGENYIWDLWVLMIWPKQWQNCCIILLRFWQAMTLDLVNRKISSAKNKCEIQTCPLNPIRWISLSWMTSSNIRKRRSKHIINRYRDNESPWHTPTWNHFRKRGPSALYLITGGRYHVHDKHDKVWQDLKKF